MLRKKTSLLLTFIFVTSLANAATHYVSDNLHTFIHSGASTKYKILGSVTVGEKIKVIKRNKNTGFTLIKDSKGRRGWINSKFISTRPGLKERLPKLEVKLTKLNEKLNTAEENEESHSIEVLKLQNHNAILNKQLEQIQVQNRKLNAKLDTQEDDLLMRWFTYGGMVGGAGLLLGLIIPILIPNRRNKRW